MFDPRIYRAGFLPALAALVLLMFSLEPAPDPIEGPVSTPVFEGRETTRLARDLTLEFPERTPGSPGDNALAQRVEDRFSEVPGGEVSDQSYDGSFGGESVRMRNVVLTLPGDIEETILITAARDSAAGPGATTSAAATATLITLADELGGTRHRRTLVLASTSGSSIGGKGVRELVEGLSLPIADALILENSGASEPIAPYVVPGGAHDGSVPAAVLATAEAIAEVQFGTGAYPRSGFDELARLAIPTGVGDAAAISDEGLDAIAVSPTGERPPSGDEGITAISGETVFQAGGTALNLLLTLDESDSAIEGGPARYVRIGDNLLPGWTLALLALALLAPGLLSAVDLFLRERRRSPRPARRAIPWALERALLPLAGLLLIYAMALVGLIPDPPFPFDPDRFPPGARGPAAFAAIAVLLGIVAILVRPLRTPLDAEPQTLAAAAGLLCGIALLGVWLLNPFLALLLTPAAHVWILPARVEGPPSRTFVAVAAALALVPALAAALVVGSNLGLGSSAAWYMLLLVADGQIGLPLVLLGCGLVGGLIACAGAAFPTSGIEPPGGGRSVRGPAGYAGPGSLGGTPSQRSRV